MKLINLLIVAFILVRFICTSSLASAETFGVFKSQDRGRSWIVSNTGMPSKSRVNAFASAGEVLFVGTDTGVFISKDEAASWQPASGVATTSGRIISLATSEATVYAGSNGKGLLLSLDRGKSWKIVESFPSKKVRCLLAHEGRIYAGTDPLL